MRPALSAFVAAPSNAAIFQEMVILNEVKDLVVNVAASSYDALF